MAIKKFSVGEITEAVEFEVDADKFIAIPANRLPAGVLAKYFEKINDSRIFDAQELFFKTVLTEDSAKLFFERMESVENPITVPVMGDIAAWLLGEVYMQGEDSAEPKQS
jgi:hypothetical protein